jgi:hypothetical protein
MPSYNVTETSITGNQDMDTVLKNRLSWKTRDDAKLVKKDLVYDNGDIATLEPQRIRVFVVEFAI